MCCLAWRAEMAAFGPLNWSRVPAAVKAVLGSLPGGARNRGLCVTGGRSMRLSGIARRQRCARSRAARSARRSAALQAASAGRPPMSSSSSRSGSVVRRVTRNVGIWGQALAIGVLLVAQCWPCGQDSQLQLECRQRSDLLHEARGGGYWFWLRGQVRGAPSIGVTRSLVSCR